MTSDYDEKLDQFYGEWAPVFGDITLEIANEYLETWKRIQLVKTGGTLIAQEFVDKVCGGAKTRGLKLQIRIPKKK